MMKKYRLTPGVSDPTDLVASWAGDTADAILIETGDPFDPAFFYTIDSTQVPDMDTISNGQKKWAEGDLTKMFFSGTNPLTYIGKTGAGDQDLIRWRGLWLDSCPVEMWNMNYGRIEHCKMSWSQFRMGGYNHDAGTGQSEFNRIQIRFTNASANAFYAKPFDTTSGGSMRNTVLDLDIAMQTPGNAARIACDAYFSELHFKVHGGTRETPASWTNPAADGMTGAQACVWFEDDGTNYHSNLHGSHVKVDVEGGWSAWNDYWHPAILWKDRLSIGGGEDPAEWDWIIHHNFLAKYIAVVDEVAANLPRGWMVTSNRVPPGSNAAGPIATSDQVMHYDISGTPSATTADKVHGWYE